MQGHVSSPLVGFPSEPQEYCSNKSPHVWEFQDRARRKAPWFSPQRANRLQNKPSYPCCHQQGTSQPTLADRQKPDRNFSLQWKWEYRFLEGWNEGRKEERMNQGIVIDCGRGKLSDSSGLRGDHCHQERLQGSTDWRPKRKQHLEPERSPGDAGDTQVSQVQGVTGLHGRRQGRKGALLSHMRVSEPTPLPMESLRLVKRRQENK